MSDGVLIVGGGLAGLATATGLALYDVPTVVLESRPRLGGRASSFQDQTSGETIDNCQHVAMGCCTNLRHWTRTTGVQNHFQPAASLTFVAPDGRLSTLRSVPLPSPLHLTPSFAGLSYLTLRDKLRLALGLRQLARAKPGFREGESFLDWLTRIGQPSLVIQRFWQVVLVSALSEDLSAIDPWVARKVFVDGFLRHREGWQVWAPTEPLDALYGPVTQWLQQHRSQVRIKSGVDSLLWDGARITGVRLRSGDELPASQVVVATPWHRVAALLPSELAERPEFAQLSTIGSAPISSVHLWFNRPITSHPHLVFVEGLCQWLFARPPANGQHYYQIVISASRDLAGRTQDEVVAEVQGELCRYLPQAREAQLLRGRVVTEHQAVFSPHHATRALRLPQQTTIPGLVLAGDWTHTGWPSTMEGAVISGYRAAEQVLTQRGVQASLVQPGLRTSFGSRWLLGLVDEKGHSQPQA